MNARGTRRPQVRRVKSQPRVKSGKSGCVLVLIALAALPAVPLLLAAWRG